jgi:surface antigen
MHRIRYLTVLMMTFSLAACEEGHEGRDTGTLIGAGAGLLIGSQVGGGGRVLAIVGGTLAGAWLGREVGKSLDHKDRAAMEQSTQHSLASSPAGTKSTWKNPDSGHSGTVTPQKIFHNQDGEKCREYHQTVNAEGRTETAYGTACQQKDGSWKVVGNH